MRTISWKGLAVSGAAILGVLAITIFAMRTPVTAQQGGERASAAAVGLDAPVQLPNHRYDLPATLITAAQIQAHKAKMLEMKKDDVPINMVEMGGTGHHQVGISLVYRLKGQSNPNFAVHDDVAEVYHVLEGAGTMLLGGTLTDWRRRPVSAGNGMGSAGTKSEGSREIHIAKGDVLIIPAGTPHRWVMADEFTAYTVVRIDPDGVAPLLKPATE